MDQHQHHATLSAQTLDLPLTDKWTVKVIGIPPLTLRDYYPPEQLWLPFVQAMVLSRAPDPEPPHKVLPKGHGIDHLKSGSGQRGQYLTKVWQSGRISRQGDCLWLYHHTKGVEQQVLPFFEHRKISKNEMKRLIRMDFPGFERVDASGKPPIITFSQDNRESLLNWCMENCTSRFHVGQKIAYFECVRDAVMAKLSIA